MFHRPTSIHGSITERCNLKCRNCDWWRGTSDRPEIGLDGWQCFVRDLRHWLGPFEMHFAGGEPFVKSGFMELLRECADRQVAAYVTTNGVLIDRQRANELAVSGIRCLNVSLDFLDYDLQDWLKGIPGTAARLHEALANIDATRSGAYSVAIATVVMKQNLRTIPDLVGFAGDRGYYIGFQVISQNFGAAYEPSWYKKSEFWPDDLGLLDETIDFLVEQKSQSSTVSNSVEQLRLMKRYFRDPAPQPHEICTVGDKMLTFNPYGDLAPCFNTPPVGHLGRSVRLAWYGWEARTRRKQIRKCRRQCALLNCHFEE
jgi:MoaA/NifB/PqqE/SkfB family radical SAM enzyme